MRRRTILLGIIVLAGLLLVLPLLVACGGGDDDTDDATKPSDTSDSPEDVTITIGNLSDFTGVAAAGMASINLGINDLVDYYNENNLIPGVKIKVVEYDGQFDPSRDIPGWRWLIEKGSDLIFTPVPPAVVTLQPVADREEVVLFTATAGLETLDPPGYLFSLGTIPQWEAYTLLKWIAENDWDYQTKGPAKIGGAAWDEPLVQQFFDAMEDYADAHPDQFEFIGGYYAPFGTFMWGPEVEALKDGDYVYGCTACLSGFAREFRNVGGEGKLIGDGPHAAFMGLIDDANAWDEIDGMLFVMATKWWNDEGELIKLTKDILYENHPGSAEDIIRSGTGYLAMYVPYILLNIIADAAEAVGPENIDSQAIYQAAESFSLVVDDVELYSFIDNRSVSSYYRIMEARETERDLFSISDWLPLVTEP